MKIFIFGIGQYFQNRKKQFWEISYDDEIIGFLDNRANQVKSYEGFPVYLPPIVLEKQFDRIVLMSTYCKEICKQLESLGVLKEQIVFWEQYRAEKTYDEMHLYITPNTEKRKKSSSVLLLTPDLGYHGGSIAIVRAAEALISRGYDVCLAASSCNADFLDEILRWGIEVVVIPSLPYLAPKNQNWVQHYDVVIVNVFTMLKLACDISQYKPVLWWIHESNHIIDNAYEHIRYKFPLYDNSLSMNKVKVYAVSEIARHAFETYYPKQIFGILPYGIPDEAFETRQHNTLSEKFVFSIIGTVCQLKSQLIFLEAASMLPEKIRQDSEFWLIGNCGQDAYGTQVQEIVKFIPQAKILGVMNRSVLKEAFRKIDCVVCASLEETMSLTITEGIMQEKICITTNRTGMARYIKDEVNGFVCQAGDAAALCDCMRKAYDMRDKSDKLRKYARKLYEDVFSMERFGERLEQALRDTEKRYYER